jgi:hypothetical protein
VLGVTKIKNGLSDRIEALSGWIFVAERRFAVQSPLEVR